MDENKNIQAETVSEEQLKEVSGGSKVGYSIMECPKCKEMALVIAPAGINYCTECDYIDRGARDR